MELNCCNQSRTPRTF